MAKKDVVRLLVKMFGDPKLQKAYRENPEKAMKAAKLTPKERALLLSGDEAAIRAYLGDTTGAQNVVQDGLQNIIKDTTSARKPPKKS